MPDQNVAESLQRLAGVQIDRTEGQGTTVLIDGLRQNLTTLNGDIFLTGKEIGVSGENSGGGSGAGNQYDSLESIPSEEISGIDVYKNPKASMTEGGLGGTIDLKMRDPLSGSDGLHVGGNLRGTTADGTNGWTPIGALVASYKVNDRFGVTGSISYDDEKTHTKEFQDENRSSWVITNSSTGPNPGNGTNATPTVLPGGQLYIDPQLAYFTDQNDERKTLGASLGLAFEVTNSWTSHLNWFYSRDDDTLISYSDKVWFNGQGDASGSTTIPGIDAVGPLLHRRQRGGPERHLQRQRRGDRHQLFPHPQRSQQLPVDQQVRSRRPAEGRFRRLLFARHVQLPGRPGRRGARALQHRRRRPDLAQRAGLQQRRGQLPRRQSRLPVHLEQRRNLWPALRVAT